LPKVDGARNRRGGFSHYFGRRNLPFCPATVQTEFPQPLVWRNRWRRQTQPGAGEFAVGLGTHPEAGVFDRESVSQVVGGFPIPPPRAANRPLSSLGSALLRRVEV